MDKNNTTEMTRISPCSVDNKHITQRRVEFMNKSETKSMQWERGGENIRDIHGH